MNNIYIDEVPDSCFYCDFFIKENYCCYLIQKDAREYRDDCPLIPLSDRLAEERKSLVKEIRQDLANKLTYNINDLEKIMVICNKINSVLDKFEGETK